MPYSYHHLATVFSLQYCALPNSKASPYPWSDKLHVTFQCCGVPLASNLATRQARVGALCRFLWLETLFGWSICELVPSLRLQRTWPMYNGSEGFVCVAVRPKLIWSADSSLQNTFIALAYLARKSSHWTFSGYSSSVKRFICKVTKLCYARSGGITLVRFTKTRLFLLQHGRRSALQRSQSDKPATDCSVRHIVLCQFWWHHLIHD